jgi:hypothetical protein
MAKFITEASTRPEHLQLIRQARPLVNPEIEEKDISNANLDAAYPVYNVGLNELKATRVALKAAPLLRVQELGSSRKIAAAYEMSADAKEATLPAVHTDTAYLTRLNTSFQVADRVAQSSPATAKMRVINVPALHTEAYWLHYEDAAKDMVVPIHSFVFPEGEPVPYATFIQKMSEAAKSIPDTSNNELGG